MTRRSGVGKGLGEKSTDDGPLPTEKVTVEIISKTGSKPKGPHMDMDIKQEDEAGPSKLNSEFCINKLLTAVGGATVMPLVPKYAFLQMTVTILSHLHCLVQSLKHFLQWQSEAWQLWLHMAGSSCTVWSNLRHTGRIYYFRRYTLKGPQDIIQRASGSFFLIRT